MSNCLCGVIKIFHIETTVNTNTFPWYLGYMQKPEPTWSFVDKIAARINKHFLDCTPLALTFRERLSAV